MLFRNLYIATKTLVALKFRIKKNSSRNQVLTLLQHGINRARKTLSGGQWCDIVSADGLIKPKCYFELKNLQ